MYSEVYSTIDFYDKLRVKYKDYLKPEIISIVMIQSEEEVFLETVEIEMTGIGLEKHTIKRINLGFIKDREDYESEEPFFNPEDTIEDNVIKFIDKFTPHSIVTTVDLFHEEACEKIRKRYKTFGIDS